MRRRIAAAMMLLLLLAPTAPACAWEMAADGVHYRMEADAAVIVRVDALLETLTVEPTFCGKPTRAEADGIEPFHADTLVLAPGITSLEPYAALIKQGGFKRIEFPATFLFDEMREERPLDTWLAAQPYLASVRLHETTPRDVYEKIIYSAAYLYQYAQYDLLDLFHAEDAHDDGTGAPYRAFTHIEIDPGHPTLYDIDGVVFERDTDTLLGFMPSRRGVYDVPAGTKAIGKGAFYLCDGLEQVRLPLDVARIEDRAFSLCAGLASIQLPPGLESVGAYAFYNCVSLAAITIPEYATVGAHAFDYCKELRAAYFPGASAEVDETAFGKCHQDLVVYAPDGTSAQRASAVAGVRWADMNGGTPQVLENPYHHYREAAIVHGMDAAEPVALYMDVSDTAKAIAWLDVGTTVEVLSWQGDFAKVSLPQLEGYMRREALRPVEKDLLRVVEVNLYGLDAFRLYTEPSLQAPYIAPQAYARYAVLQRFGTWYIVRGEEGALWYVPTCNADAYALNFDDEPILIVYTRSEEVVTALYSQPSFDSEVLGVYYDGTQVRTDGVYIRHGEEKAFRYVEIDGIVGYMPENALFNLRDEWFYYAD